MFIDKLLLGFKYVHQLSEILQLHGIIYPFQLDCFYYFFEHYLKNKGYDTEKAINQQGYLLLLLKSQFLPTLLNNCIYHSSHQWKTTS